MKSSHARVTLNQSIKKIQPLVVANDAGHFMLHDGRQGSVRCSPKLLLECCTPEVIDPASLELIQVLELHKAIDHTHSATGSAVLLRSLLQPSTDLHYIRSKQASVGEILSDDRLRQFLADLIGQFSLAEGALYNFFNKGLVALSPYLDLKRARQAAVDLARLSATLPVVESSFLSLLLQQLQTYAGSSLSRMMAGPIYKTFKGLKSDREAGLLTPKLKFVPRRITKWLLAGPAMFAAPYIHSHLGLGAPLSPMLSTLGAAWTGIGLFYGLFVKPVKDTGNFVEPLRVQSIHDPVFSRAIDAVGRLDELLSFCEFAGKSSQATTRPRIMDDDHHAFEARGLNNPILAGGGVACVPNTIRMQDTRLTFITGPNSGGKTTLCKSIVHNQLLAQIGSHVLAEKAAINIADMIRYQAPKFDGLQDEEGRFGTELGRTRDIFYATGPRSLVILDELAEGTTHEERMQTARGILSDFNTIGNNTILVTHNHSLVDRFMAERKGQCLKVEFRDDDPTYKVLPGISRVSHADRIAEKINFSRADRRRYLHEKGYL